MKFNPKQEKEFGFIKLHYTFENKNPKKIIAIEGINANYSQYNTDLELKYWYSDNFGAKWIKADSSIFENLSFKNNLANECTYGLGIYRLDAYLDHTKIETNSSFMSSIENIGWFDKNHYYILSEDGVQIGVKNNYCKPDKNILYSWTYKKRETGIRYNISDLANRDWDKDVRFHKNRGELFDLKEDSFKKIIFNKENNNIQFIIPCYYGGLWYGEIPQNESLTFRRFLHFFVNNHIVLYLYFLFIIYIVFINYKLTSKNN
ncbi:MAG: hypothetical protein JXR51_04395 [Bacteroidales bacterium]|nr:hypothetical protein [Bacteroidales bacterium]